MRARTAVRRCQPLLPDDQPREERSVVLALRWLADDEQRPEPAGDEHGADQVGSPDGPLFDHAAEGQGEHDGHDQDRLHEDHASNAERDRLRDEANALGKQPEEPDRLRHEPGQEPRADRFRGLFGGGFLLQHEPEREEECRDEREHDVHAATLRAALLAR